MSDTEDILNEFLIESHEGLDKMEQALLALEKKPDDRDALLKVFRTIHTIKGTASFLGLREIESISHEGESLLSDLRDGTRAMDEPIASALLETLDALRRLLAAIEHDGTEGKESFGELVSRLQAVRAGESRPAPKPKGKAAKAEPPAPAAKPAPAAAKPAPAAAKPAPEPPEPAAEEAVGESAAAASTLRIDVALLDRLMNLIGELVLARNQILQHTARSGDAGLGAAVQGLNRITSELQEGLMKTRMQPLSNIWNKFPRVTRDLSHACGKKVRILMQGEGTEVDKAIIEALRDPMVHVVRNAVDHGIESPERRKTLGKPEEGSLRLTAYHEAGQVIVEMADDGAGIDPAIVRAKAVKKGLIPLATAQKMSDEEALRLVFLPGFSTSETVTNISGRGVGMDVVKSGVERIGGSVELRSELGRGCMIQLKIPLTLAIIPGLIVRAAQETFAIPQVNLIELVRLSAEQKKTAIERVHNAPVYRLRGKLLPIVELARVLGLEGGGGGGDAANIVVLRAEGREFGLLVDQILDTEEIVVKPLSQQLKRLGDYMGATIRGDGRVYLILDVVGLARQAHVVAEAAEHRGEETVLPAAASPAAAAAQSLIVFRVDQKGRMGMPVSRLERLEEIAWAQVEATEEGPVVQYRGDIMPLVPLHEYFGHGKLEPQARLQVLVVRRESQLYGLVVDQIVDIVEEAVGAPHGAHRRGILGSIVVQQHVTEILDADAIIADAEKAAESGAALGGGGK